MLRYIITRLVWVVIMLFAILTTTFVLLKTAPEFPPPTNQERDMWLTEQYQNGFMTMETSTDPTVIKDFKARADGKHSFFVQIQGSSVGKFFQRVPIVIQYVNWMRNVFQWNWGTSSRVQMNVPVFRILGDRIPLTMALNFLALLIYLPVGIIIGIVAALKKNKLTDNIIQVAVMIFIAIPGLVLIMFLIMIFSYNLQWLPTRFPPSYASTNYRALGFVIPVLAMSIPSIASLTRITRAELGEVLTSDFVLLARTKGLSHKQAVIRHAIRNSMVPLVPTVIGSFVGLVSGSVVIERIYGIPGTGSIFIQAMQQNAYDYNLIMALTAFYTFIGLVTTLVVDLSYGFVDPRIRIGGKKNAG